MTVAAADPLVAAFLADIIAHPGEDAPRLIYADWLDEHSEPDRAEFIRVQCGIARVVPGEWCVDGPRDDGEPTSGCDCHRCERLRRQAALFDALGRDGLDCRGFEGLPLEVDGLAFRWASPVGPSAADARAVFRRGFLAEVALPCAAWLAHGPDLARAAPLETVRLTDRRPGALGDGRAAWFGHTPARASLALADLLPEPLMTRLPGGRNPGCTSTRAYTSREAALAALSAACLAFAREKACLPPLPPGVPPP